MIDDPILSSQFDLRLDINRQRLMQEYTTTSGNNPMTENFSVFFSRRCEWKFLSENNTQDWVKIETKVETSIVKPVEPVKEQQPIASNKKKYEIELCYYNDKLMWCKVNGEYIRWMPPIIGVSIQDLPTDFMCSLREDSLLQLNMNDQLNDQALITIPKFMNTELIAEYDQEWMIKVSISNDELHIDKWTFDLIVDPYSITSLF